MSDVHKIADVRTMPVVTGGVVVRVTFEDGRYIHWPTGGQFDDAIMPLFEMPSNEDIVQAMHESVKMVRWYDTKVSMCNAKGGVS